ncbi:hypothetical protein PTKIN_Ptkin02bG0049300 [Pterospermum kingtungense]
MSKKEWIHAAILSWCSETELEKEHKMLAFGKSCENYQQTDMLLSGEHVLLMWSPRTFKGICLQELL